MGLSCRWMFSKGRSKVAELAIARWSTGSVHLVIIARGMPHARFQHVSKVLIPLAKVVLVSILL